MSVLTGKMAPDFSADAMVNGEFSQISLSRYRGQYVVLFFYPLDFTFVCPTELHAFEERMPEFNKRNVSVIGVSVDSKYSHLAWWRMPKADGGISGVTYPIVSDIHKNIAETYDVLCQEQGVAFRGLFLIDRSGIVRHQVVNDLPLGRSVDEVIRMVDALVFFEEHGEVCPANWRPGQQAMRPDDQGLKTWFSHS